MKLGEELSLGIRQFFFFGHNPSAHFDDFTAFIRLTNVNEPTKTGKLHELHANVDSVLNKIRK